MVDVYVIMNDPEKIREELATIRAQLIIPRDRLQTFRQDMHPNDFTPEEFKQLSMAYEDQANGLTLVAQKEFLEYILTDEDTIFTRCTSNSDVTGWILDHFEYSGRGGDSDADLLLY
jgi:hypothetical protein